MDNVAARIIRKCGGHQVVAGMLGVHVSRVHRWTYDRARGGTGGVIPTRHQSELLARARAAGIDLTAADFFDAPPATDDGKAAA